MRGRPGAVVHCVPPLQTVGWAPLPGVGVGAGGEPDSVVGGVVTALQVIGGAGATVPVGVSERESTTPEER